MLTRNSIPLLLLPLAVALAVAERRAVWNDWCVDRARRRTPFWPPVRRQRRRWHRRHIRPPWRSGERFSAAPVHVQSTFFQIGASSKNTVTGNFSANTTSGNAVVVAVSWGTQNVQISSVTHGGTSGVAALARFGNPATTYWKQVWVIPNVAGGSTGVTVNWESNISGGGIVFIHEYSGLKAADVVGQTNSQTDQTGHPTASGGSITTSAANSLIFGFVGTTDFQSDITAGTGFTRRVFDEQFRATEDKVEASASTNIAATFTLSSSTTWAACTVELLSGPAPSWTFVANRGTAQNKTSGGTLNLTPTATLAAGRVAIVRASSDNDSTATSSGQTTRHSVSDSAGNTWVKIREHTFSAGAAADGVTHSLWYSVLTTQLTTSSTVTLTLGSNVTAKAMALAEFSVPSGNTVSLAGQNGAQGTGTNNVTVTVSSLASKQYLFLGSVGTEGPDGDTFTQDSDYQNLASIGTTGGGTTSNVSLRGGYRIATLTGDTYNPTLGTSRDWVDILGVLLSEADSGVVVSPAPAAAGAGAFPPTIVLGSLALTPAPAAAQAAALAPSVVFGSLALAPAPAAAQAAALAPSVVFGSLALTPAPAAAQAAALAPSVVFGSLALAPAPAEAAAAAVAPTVDISDLVVQPASAEALAAAVAPAVVLGGIVFSPAPAAAGAGAFPPTIILGSLALTPAPAAAQAAALAPSVVFGSLALAPAPAEAAAAAVAPTVDISDLVVQPASAEALAAAVAPAVVLGSITVVPSTAIAVAEAVPPAIAEGDLVVQPASAEALAAAVAPAVVLGGIVFSPAPAGAFAAAIGPAVVLGSVTIVPSAAAAVAEALPPIVIISSPPEAGMLLSLILIRPAVGVSTVTAAARVAGEQTARPAASLDSTGSQTAVAGQPGNRPAVILEEVKRAD